MTAFAPIAADHWIATEAWCAETFDSGWFSGGDEPDEFHTLDGRVFKLNVPLCNGCDRPLEDGHCDACELPFTEFLRKHGFSSDAEVARARAA